MVESGRSRLVAGSKGWGQLLRIIARVFYSGEIPPKEEEEETVGGKNGNKSYLQRGSYEGLGVLLLDFLASDSVEGFVDESVLAAELRLSQKFIRKTLRYLESEHLLVSESVKFAFRRTNVEQPDDEEIEVKKRHETHVFWAVDYPRVLDTVRLKIRGIQELLKRNSGNNVSIVTYQCPSCGAHFSSLQAASLIDPIEGVFRCEECHSVLQEKGGEEVAGLSGSSMASKKERQHFFKDLAVRFEAQIKPIVQQMDALSGMDPPDPGSLKDWYTARKNEATKRAQRLEEARAKFKSSGASGAIDMTEEQLLEWADRAEMVIELAGTKTSDIVEEEAKELPAWFRKQHDASDSVAQESRPDQEQKQKQLEMEYLQQYLRTVEAMKAGGTNEDIKEEKEELVAKKEEEDEKEEEEVVLPPDAKRIKVEEQNGVEGQEEEEDEWEDA